MNVLVCKFRSPAFAARGFTKSLQNKSIGVKRTSPCGEDAAVEVKRTSPLRGRRFSQTSEAQLRQAPLPFAGRTLLLATKATMHQ